MEEDNPGLTYFKGNKTKMYPSVIWLRVVIWTKS